jgi:hypothetical protein
MKSFSEKIILSKIFFGIWFARKKLRNAKIIVWQMSPESGNARSPLSDSGSMTGSWPFLPDPAGSVVGFVQIWQDQ